MVPFGSSCGRLREHLGDSLGGAHHAGRIDRLVGRDEHEPIDAELLDGSQEVRCAEDIGLHRLRGPLLEDRHVLVRSGVEHDLGLHLLEDAARDSPVANVAQNGIGLERPMHATSQGVVQMRLVVVEGGHLDVIELEALADDLRPDRATGAGDQDATTAEHVRRPARDRSAPWPAAEGRRARCCGCCLLRCP